MRHVCPLCCWWWWWAGWLLVAWISLAHSTIVHIEWMNLPPYVQYPGNDTNISSSSAFSFSGVFASVLDNMLQECLPGYVSDNTTEQEISHRYQPYLEQQRRAAGHVTVSLPRFRRQLQHDPASEELFVSVLDLPGSVYFYRRPEEPVASDLLTVIMQGWPMLVLILLGAGYSGIIIWLLDRLWNETNFPKPFIRGFWEGFWWAFVTMTTVGYGDTTPRSIQARIYGLVWIVVGITILSVFTATVTAVLTQESLAIHKTVQGLTIGVVNGTDDFRLVIAKGGQPIIFPDYPALLTNMRSYNSVIKGALIDQYMFAAHLDLLTTEEMLVESLESNPLTYGFTVAGLMDPIPRQCIASYGQRREHEILVELTQWIKPITVITTTSAEKAQTLFQPQTVQYMWYGLGVWVIIFIGFVCWEFCYWRPKHISRKEMKSSLGRVIKTPVKMLPLSNGHGPNRLHIHRPSAASMDLYGCIGKPVKYRYTNHAFYTEESQNMDYTGKKKVSFSDVQIQTDRRASEGTLSVLEKGVRLEEEDEGSAPSVAQLEECLENMLVRQHREMDSVNGQFSKLKKRHDRCLRELHRKHKAERRKLLDIIRACEEENPCDVILVPDELSGNMHPVSVYDV